MKRWLGIAVAVGLVAVAPGAAEGRPNGHVVSVARVFKVGPKRDQAPAAWTAPKMGPCPQVRFIVVDDGQSETFNCNNAPGPTYEIGMSHGVVVDVDTDWSHGRVRIVVRSGHVVVEVTRGSFVTLLRAEASR